MKVTYTGYSTITSYKKNPDGVKYVLIGILYRRPGWEGVCAETKIIPYTWLDTVSRLTPNTSVDIQEFNNQIMAIEPLRDK